MTEGHSKGTSLVELIYLNISNLLVKHNVFNVFCKNIYSMILLKTNAVVVHRTQHTSRGSDKNIYI